MMRVLKMSIRSNGPLIMVVVVNPTDGVAHALPVFVALQRVVKTTASNNFRYVNFRGMLNSLCYREE